MFVEHFAIEGQGRPWTDPGLTRLTQGQADPGPGPAVNGPALRTRVKGQQNGLDLAQPDPQTV